MKRKLLRFNFSGKLEHLRSEETEELNKLKYLGSLVLENGILEVGLRYRFGEGAKRMGSVGN